MDNDKLCHLLLITFASGDFFNLSTIKYLQICFHNFCYGMTETRNINFWSKVHIWNWSIYHILKTICVFYTILSFIYGSFPHKNHFKIVGNMIWNLDKWSGFKISVKERQMKFCMKSTWKRALWTWNMHDDQKTSNKL